MQKSSLYLTVGLLLAIVVSLYSCVKKVNGINNDQVIETPYSLYFSDTAGALYNSNDGHSIQRTVFRADGFPCRAICTVNSNILWAKNNLYISVDNGANFNHSYDSLASYPFVSCSNLWQDLNQSMIINIPDWGMVYTVSESADPINYLGIVFSLNVGGLRGYWWYDIPDTLGNMGNYGPGYQIQMTSFTMLKNQTLCGYDAIHNRNFYRTKGILWNECTANPDTMVDLGIGSPLNHGGIHLPYNDLISTPVDTGVGKAWYCYGHLNNTLIAIDQRNCNGGGGYFSNDTGRNWTKYGGLPNVPLLCVGSPFEEICLIGTDSAGLYELNTNTNAFQPQKNNGLGNYVIVRSIVAKENIYKNGVIKKFVYLATNLGIYQSTDGGHNWVKTIPGNFVAVY